MSEESIVIVGAGHAGVQAAVSLREDGYAGAITLLSDETELPYQRPPLSKAFLKGQMELDGLPLRVCCARRDSISPASMPFARSATPSAFAPRSAPASGSSSSAPVSSASKSPPPRARWAER